MPSLNIEQFGDLLQATIARFERPDYTNLVTDLVDHPFAKAIMKKNMVKAGGGTRPEFRIRVATSNAARMIPVTAHDAVNAADGLIAAYTQYRKGETKYMFYEEEMDINIAPARLVDLV